jgi:hypothetical protein
LDLPCKNCPIFGPIPCPRPSSFSIGSWTTLEFPSDWQHKASISFQSQRLMMEILSWAIFLNFINPSGFWLIFYAHPTSIVIFSQCLMMLVVGLWQPFH